MVAVVLYSGNFLKFLFVCVYHKHKPNIFVSL